jgi:pimeloyl-ACP methyl ester carboxylesterase
LPFLGLILLLPRTPVSLTGGLYALSYFLICLGMLFAPWQPQRSYLFIFIGSAMALVTIAMRLLAPPSRTRINLVTLPGQTGPRLLNRLFNEQDIVLFGAKAAPYLGLVTSLEKKSLDQTFYQAVEEMRSEGATPLSPFLATYLNQQSPERFDLVVSEPVSGRPPATGIIFLHGFGGNFTLQCWLIAGAGDSIDAITVCPSTGPVGAWWSTSGTAILQETISYLQQRGVERVYLAGLSNGAIGASRIANQLQQNLVGLILVSGADPAAPIAELPVLLLHGKDDQRIPVTVMERYAAAAGSNATYRVFDGDHFLLLKEAGRVRETMIDWLHEQELNSP